MLENLITDSRKESGHTRDEPRVLLLYDEPTAHILYHQPVKIKSHRQGIEDLHNVVPRTAELAIDIVCHPHSRFEQPTWTPT